MCTLLVNSNDPESLLGYVVAFYALPKIPFQPSDYFFRGHVSEPDALYFDESVIRTPIKVTSLDNNEYRYFGMTSGDVWRILLVDVCGELVVFGRSPTFFYDHA